MPSVQFIDYKGKRICHIDLIGADLSAVNNIIAQAKPMIAKQPPASVLTLTDATGLHISPEISTALKEFAAHNKPYVKAGAVVGIEGIRRVAFNALLVFTGRRNLHLCEGLQKAKDWLAEQQ